MVWDSPYHVLLKMHASELEIRLAVIDETTTRVELITRRCNGSAMHDPRTVLKSSQQVQNGGDMAKKREEKTLDERQMMFLKTLAHGLRTGSISYDAYAKVRRLAVGDGDEEYYTVWNGVGRASQKILNEMTLEDLQFFVEQGRLTNFNDQQYQVNSHLILSAVPEE